MASAKSNRELQQLPFVFRTTNTSPIPAIAVLPEVQKGSGTEFSLSGSLPYQNEVSVDGILTTNIRRNGIGDGGENIFPSLETIQEIKVSSINNSAEYAQVGDITTITRSGGNEYHGSVFWNYNGTSMNADPNYFSRTLVTTSVNNNAGGSLGGRILRDRTFFFTAFERLSILGSGLGVATVPEADFRRGDFTSLSTRLTDPTTNAPFAGNIIPASRITQPSRTILDQFIAAPNTRPNEARYTIPTSTISNQFDARVDHYFGDRHNIFGRLTFKNWDRVSPTAQQASGPRTERRPTRNLVFSDNYVFRPNLINEFRFGFTIADIRPKTALRGRDFIAATGLQIISPNPPDITGTSHIEIAGYSRFGENKEEPLDTHNYEWRDNVTWTRGRHTLKAGFDVKRFNWKSPLNFTGADDYGVFRFNNSLPGGTGNPVANFLLGLPTEVDQTQTGPGVDGVANQYGWFIQDEWRVNSRLTLSMGLRYELHPGFRDRELNITNFLRDTPNGDFVVPNEDAKAIAAPGFLASTGTARMLTAAEAGLPESLRKTDKNNFAPRLGIAWRPFDDNRTVLRMGYGIYTTRILGAVFNSLTGIHTSDNATYRNALDPQTGVHAIVWPRTAAGQASRGESPVGNQNFSTANDPAYRDPYTQQWSFTIERELSRTNSLRLTYSGSQTVHLTLAPDLNQILPNTIGFANLPRTARPFPNWNRINTRDNGGNGTYNDFTIQLKGLALEGLLYTTS
ncbi:MAG: TonB-dependent receptor, partial [Planctomycetia bacterium]|nr:TonB-dependent receptor [Planctomycetia bacterium]